MCIYSFSSAPFFRNVAVKPLLVFYHFDVITIVDIERV